jgi:hypothetical protein
MKTIFSSLGLLMVCVFSPSGLAAQNKVVAEVSIKTYVDSASWVSIRGGEDIAAQAERRSRESRRMERLT